MRAAPLIALLTIALQASVETQAASFDCERASTQTERFICSDELLSELDSRLAKAYVRFLKAQKDSKPAREQQRKWITEIRDRCTNKDCLGEVYSKRISQLMVPESAGIAQAPGAHSHESTSTCLAQVLRKDAPYDIFVGVANDRRTFIKARSGGFGLSKDSVPIFDHMAWATAREMCDANFVVVWQPETYGKFPEFLMGRIYNKNLEPQTDEFRITESDDSQSEYDVAPLLNGGFVVTWKSPMRGQTGKVGIKIRARIFRSNGTAIGKSFTISTSQGNDGQASVVGLPDGALAVAWRTFGTGIYLRVFGPSGAPKTDQIFVVKEDEPSRGYVPYMQVTRGGHINVFLRYFYDLHEDTPFRVARSYDSNGEALTDILTGEAITNLAGYQESVERLVRQAGHQLEYRMREYLHKDVMGFRFCESGLADVSLAAKSKAFSRKADMRRFFTVFCQEHQRSCKPPGYPDRKQELEQCARSE